MSWSARLYSTFETERTRPVRDLVAALPERPVTHGTDLGCGPGNSTAVLAARFPDAALTGLDSSPDMIAAARERMPSTRFELADIATWQAALPQDVILANASLQWLPDHATLYPRLLAQLSAGGSLAIQTPDNIDEPAHRVAREVASAGPWAARLENVRHLPRHTADWYYALLRPHCARVDVWRTTYYHPLADAAAIVEWFKASVLRPYLGALQAAERDAFLHRYHAGIAQAYPALPDGSVLLPFPRLFIVASRAQ
ncbi:trans-aconitate 2-methyltransferase [Chitinasiproducens palmae]|uniref:Trans-aconitate 2-methyltransferase n=1 Tax=Chitinasiproducens palmae TaxID=1770053 RepID=A0A1H2PQ03_9BURK|nr:trans-aconitate 2-methyltransferase [Chitinasiproducens palmae]SDV48425.1 trans-aconitate 2-methyltransferase [Chitinasiproducens palmae]